MFSIGDFDGRNFAGGRQEATPEPDSDYAECLSYCLFEQLTSCPSLNVAMMMTTLV